LRSSCFDLVAVAFGIRNFADLGGGLAEIRRCLKPGGSILTLEFFLPERGIFAGLYRFYLWRVLPLLGETISGVRGAYSYLRDSVEDFVTPEELSKLMADAGFHDVSHRLLTGGIVAIHQGRRAA
jgi:demethylmenaquinone methyltransferase/2-methoxy-6-polyprenyl-1,4-benzoquinol methylase